MRYGVQEIARFRRVCDRWSIDVVFSENSVLHAREQDHVTCGTRARVSAAVRGSWTGVCETCFRLTLREDEYRRRGVFPEPSHAAINEHVVAAALWQPNPIDLKRALRALVDTNPTQQGDPMQRYVRFYQDGDAVAISTTCTDEGEFSRTLPGALSEFIASGTGSTVDLLAAAMPNIVDLYCKLRGYKAPLVEEQRVLTAGRIPPRESLLVASSEGTHEQTAS